MPPSMRRIRRARLRRVRGSRLSAEDRLDLIEMLGAIDGRVDQPRRFFALHGRDMLGRQSGDELLYCERCVQRLPDRLFGRDAEPSGLAPPGIPLEARSTVPAKATGGAYSGLISGSPGPNGPIASGPAIRARRARRCVTFAPVTCG